MAVVFFVTSFSLAIFAKQRAEVAGQAGIPVVQESPEASDAPVDMEESEAESGESSSEDELPELE